VRIRNFGFLANRKRATLLPLCFQLLGSAQQPQAEQHASSTEDFSDSWRCPKSGGPMKVPTSPAAGFLSQHYRAALTTLKSSMRAEPTSTST
jgi:hypothetical protein